MMTDNRTETTELASFAEDVKSSRSHELKKSYSFFVLVLTNLVSLAVLVTGGWWFIVQPYVDSIEKQLSDAVSATRGVATLSEIKDVQGSIDALQARIGRLEQSASGFADIQQELQSIQLKLKELDQEKSKALHLIKSHEWKDAVSKAISKAQPLEEFRQNSLIPEKVRETMRGIDFIPTHKNISESWSKIRNTVKFQEQVSQKSTSDSTDWWSGFKVFLKSMFKVQRLDKDNLTAEEVFLRQIDKLLIENEIIGLLELMDKHSSRFDGPTQALLKEWVKKLNTYQQGQLILKMVNEVND